MFTSPFQRTDVAALRREIKRKMSSHPRSEYIRDVPTDVNFSRILPPPSVSVPDIVILRPRILDVHYDFSKEKIAIAAYNKRRKEMAKEKETGASQLPHPVAPSTSSSSSTTSSPVPPIVKLPMWTDGILQPTLVERRSSSKPTSNVCNGPSILPTETARKADPFDFKDFESATNVFDLMELKTIDDKAELEKLSSATATVNSFAQPDVPYPTCAAATSSIPVQSRDYAYSTTSLFNRPTSSIPYNPPTALPNTVSAPAIVQQNQQREMLSEKPLSQAGERLVKEKKFPRAVVEYCEENLLSDEMEKLDYFVKALYNMSVKMKINKAEALIFLQSFNFDEKRKIVSVSDAVLQLCGMGFDSQAVLNALRTSAGQRDSALDHLLNRSTAASS